MLNRLLILNEQLVERVKNNTLQPAVPIKAVKAPIKAKKSWEEKDGQLIKKITFKNIDDRNLFLYEILSLESEKGHHAKIYIFEKSVKLFVGTRDLSRVTELDKEYTQAVDLIEREING